MKIKINIAELDDFDYSNCVIEYDEELEEVDSLTGKLTASAEAFKEAVKEEILHQMTEYSVSDFEIVLDTNFTFVDDLTGREVQDVSSYESWEIINDKVVTKVSL